ncbi:MAG: transcription repressor NadR [Bacillota bacterium]
MELSPWRSGFRKDDVMQTEKRRQEILKILMGYHEPITGTELSKRFDVSRQVIVQDIAVIRAQGHDVIATSNGYMILKQNRKEKNIKTVVCKHEGYKAIEEELKIMVDMGAKVLDVIVEHPVYGEIRVPLMICSRMDLEEFLERVRREQAEPLSSLTGGEHIHTLEVPNDRVFEKMIKTLREKGYLFES